MVTSLDGFDYLQYTDLTTGDRVSIGTFACLESYMHQTISLGAIRLSASLKPTALYCAPSRFIAATRSTTRAPSPKVFPPNVDLTRGMKRSTKSKPDAKKTRPKAPDYCEVETKKDGSGNAIWPAPMDAIEKARSFIIEW